MFTEQQLIEDLVDALARGARDETVIGQCIEAATVGRKDVTDIAAKLMAARDDWYRSQGKEPPTYRPEAAI